MSQNAENTENNKTVQSNNKTVAKNEQKRKIKFCKIDQSCSISNGTRRIILGCKIVLQFW
ncbi:hypothetical protein LDL59_11690 [Kaistella anthropi]|nr:hypothetical protein [Kaistella anthropi]